MSAHTRGRVWTALGASVLTSPWEESTTHSTTLQLSEVRPREV